MIEIKLLGQEPKRILTPEQAVVALKNLYAGKSVSVHWVSSQTGMKRLIMLDVTDSGNIKESYGKQLDVDLLSLLSE